MKKFDDFSKPMVNEALPQNYSYQSYTQPAISPTQLPGAPLPLHFFQNSANTSLITQQSVQNVYASGHRDDNISPSYHPAPRKATRPQRRHASRTTPPHNNYRWVRNNHRAVPDNMPRD